LTGTLLFRYNPTMYYYRVEKVTRLLNTNTVTAILDLGFGIKVTQTFKLARVEVPESDFFSESDPEYTLRTNIVQWLKTAPKPLFVQMHKEAGSFTGEIIDSRNNVMADDLISLITSNDDTVVINYAATLPQATAGPGLS